MIEVLKKHSKKLGTVGVILGTVLLVLLQTVYLRNALLAGGEGVRSTAKLQLLLFALALLFSWRVWRRPDITVLLAALLGVFMVLATVVSPLYNAAEGITTVSKVVLWFFLFLIGYVGTRYYRADRVMPLLLVGGVLILGTVFMRTVYANHVDNIVDRVLTSVYFLICCAPFVCTLRSKVLKTALLAALTVAVFSSVKRSAILVWVAVLVVVLVLHLGQIRKLKKWYDLLFVAAGLAVGVFIVCFYIKQVLGGFDRLKDISLVWLKRFSDGEGLRKVLRLETWEAWKNADLFHKLFGHGYNAAMNVTQEHLSSHNDYLEILYNYGLISLTLFFCFVVALAVKALRLLRTDHCTAVGLCCALTIWLVASVPSHMITYNTYFLLIALYLGYATGRPLPAVARPSKIEQNAEAKTIGILTFHRAQNYGAYLQCYALAQKLSERFPMHRVEVVDYTSAHLSHTYRVGTFANIFSGGGIKITCKRLGKVLADPHREKAARNARKARSENFRAVINDLPLSSGTLTSDQAASLVHFLQKRYDMLVVGSDAIWNDAQTAHPNLYLLRDVKNCVKVSYAASTYGMDIQKLSRADWRYTAKSLADFSMISVRDRVSADFVTRADPSLKPRHACDPTVFLPLDTLPVDKTALREKLTRHGIDFSRPIVGLMCGERLARAVRAALGDRYLYVSVYARNGCEDVFLDDLTPYEWAHVFSFFTVTFTHYFHGTIFSLKNGTRTFAIEPSTPYSAKYPTKIEDLLKRLDLLDVCYRKLDRMDDDAWAEIAACITAPDPALAARYATSLAREAKTGETTIRKMRRFLH